MRGNADIGEFIRITRQRQRMSQRDLSKVSGLSCGYISQIETGERRLNGKTIDKLANGLGIDVRDLDEVNFGGIPECDEAISSILPPIPEPTILVTKKKADPIRPAHYQSGDGDVIDFTNKYDLDFTRGSAVKYIARAGKKDPATEAQDLEKAIECLRRAIEFCKAKEAGE